MLGGLILDSGENDVVVASTVPRTVLTLDFCNTDTVDHNVNIYAYPDGITKLTWIMNWKIPAGDTLSFTSDDKKLLQTNAKITATPDVAGKIHVITNYDDEEV